MRKGYFVLFPIILSIVGFLSFEEGPESLKHTGLYTHEEDIIYHRNFNINDLLLKYNKYTLNRLSEYINVSSIYRKGPISELPQNLNANIGKIIMRTPRYGILALDDFIKQSSSQGFLVIHKGEIIYERYDKMQDYQYHGWMSVSKTLVGWALHVLNEQGKIDFSKKIEEYLPLYKGTAYGKATIRNTMNMSSGVFSGDADFSSFLPYFRFKNAGFGEEFYKQFRLMPKSSVTPGEYFKYSSSDTAVLTMVVEKIADQSFGDWLTQNLWNHIGPEHDAQMGLFGITMGKGYPVSGGSGLMISTLRDLGRYAMLYTPSWNKVSNKKLISDKHLADLRHAQDKPLMDVYYQDYISPESFFGTDVGFGPSDKPIYAGNQWDMFFSDGDMIKVGVNSQGLYVSPDKDLVVAYFGYDEQPPEFTHAYARAIARYLVDGKIQQYSELGDSLNPDLLQEG